MQKTHYLKSTSTTQSTEKQYVNINNLKLDQNSNYITKIGFSY
ncbi:hypothetical protein J2772_002142 [Chryseobacterium jejuense]|nr:hypothetical protein [Chryseobacterium jejuense]